jgi:MarR family 2-MHQ and catechol resistance regulon transcriptional repressor
MAMRTTTYKGSKEEIRALNAYVKLVRAAESLIARVHRPLSDTGLSVRQFGVLEALYHLGPLSQSEIAKKVLRSTGNITMVIDNLEKQGLVKRERQTEDRRYYAVRLTPGGRNLIGGVFPGHAARIVAEMKVLSGDEQEVLGRLCRRLGLQSVTGGNRGKSQK